MMHKDERPGKMPGPPVNIYRNQLSGAFKVNFRLDPQKGCSVKHCADMALMFGIKQSADDLLINAKTSGKLGARKAGVKHGVVQGRFHGQKRIESNKGIATTTSRLRYALTTQEVPGYGFGEAIFCFNKGFFRCLSVSGRAGEIGKFYKIKTILVTCDGIRIAVSAHRKSSFVRPRSVSIEDRRPGPISFFRSLTMVNLSPR
jgi:hypothetical protein